MIRIDMETAGTFFRLVKGEALPVDVYGKNYTLTDELFVPAI